MALQGIAEWAGGDNRAGLQRVNGVAHYAEDHGFDVVTERNGRKGRIGRQKHRPGQQLQALAGELAVDGGDDDVAVLRPVETLHDQQVAVEDTGVLHRLPLGAHQVGIRRQLL